MIDNVNARWAENIQKEIRKFRENHPNLFTIQEQQHENQLCM